MIDEKRINRIIRKLSKNQTYEDIVLKRLSDRYSKLQDNINVSTDSLYSSFKNQKFNQILEVLSLVSKQVDRNRNFLAEYLVKMILKENSYEINN